MFQIRAWMLAACATPDAAGAAALAMRAGADPEVVAELPVIEIVLRRPARLRVGRDFVLRIPIRSEEHTSELQSLMRISYAVFCLKKKKKKETKYHPKTQQN